MLPHSKSNFYKYFKHRRCKGCGKKCTGFRCRNCYSKSSGSTLSRSYSNARYLVINNKVKNSTFTWNLSRHLHSM